jgi:hypothetical protein
MCHAELEALKIWENYEKGSSRFHPVLQFGERKTIKGFGTI